VGIAVDAADGSLWVVTQSRVARLAPDGSLLVNRETHGLGSGNGAPRLLALNPNDGSIWVAFENRTLHLGRDGALQHTLNVAAQDLAVAQDGSLWVLAQSSLHHYDSAANALQSAALGTNRRMKTIALDDTGGALWVAAEKEVLKLSLTSGLTLLSFFAPETVSALSVDIQTGDLFGIALAMR
jgi:hypothetical protein